MPSGAQLSIFCAAALLMLAPATMASSSKLSVAALAAEFRGLGYQAEDQDFQSIVAPDGDQVVGLIDTIIDGKPISVQLHKRPNCNGGEICTVNFIAFFDDDRNLIAGDTLAAANSISAISKVSAVAAPGQKPRFIVSYNHVVREGDDAEFLKSVVPLFLRDVSGVLDLYKSGFHAG